jgi:hypothetical protein
MGCVCVFQEAVCDDLQGIVAFEVKIRKFGL